MRAQALHFDGKGGVEVLRLGELSVRDPGPGEVRVRVVAAGLNRADILQRRGFYPAPPGVPADVPGLEFAGEVESLGEGVPEVAVGARVMGLSAGGAMATLLVAHARELLPVPDGLDLIEAAALPEAFSTAYDALYRQADLRLGRTLLVHAIGSGVGTAALQLASLSGAHVVGTSRTASKLARCQELGSMTGICVEDGAFAGALRDHAPNGADVILDTVGASYLDENLRALAPLGTIVTIGLLGGVKAELNLGLLLAKRARLMGSVIRSRPLEEKIALAQDMRLEVLPLIAAGRFRPVIDDILPMQEAAAAHTRMESGDTFGKLVLRW